MSIWWKLEINVRLTKSDGSAKYDYDFQEFDMTTEKITALLDSIEKVIKFVIS